MADLVDRLGKLFRGGARVVASKTTNAKLPAPAPSARVPPDAAETAGLLLHSRPSIERPLVAESLVAVNAKRPDTWVDRGVALQPVESGERVMPIRIGLDFGTSYSKLAVRFVDRTLIVDWDGVLAQQGSRYLPGELSRIDPYRVLLGTLEQRTRLFENLKLPMMEPQEERSRRMLAVAYLASVFIYARGWLWHHHSQLLAGRRVAWQLNIGCPTEHWGAAKIHKRYLEIALNAWQVSRLTAPASLMDVTRVMNAPVPEAASIGLDGISIVPEFVAEIAEYVFSPQRKDGLHLLVDVGAGTLDIACFNVYSDSGENVFPIFGSRVCPLGARLLMQARYAECNGRELHWNDRQEIPSATQFADEIGVDERKILDADSAFAARVISEIADVLHSVKQNYHPKAPEWRTGLRVFLMGGGAACPLFHDALVTLFNRLKVPLLLVGPGADTVGYDGGIAEVSDARRLAVARGLTFDAEGLGRIKTTDQIETFRIADRSGNRPERDELYPK